jgi:diacylglycerol kinase (ATP)
MTNCWFIIVNPTSGGGRAERVSTHVVDLLREWGVQAEVLVTQVRGDGARLAKVALDRGAKQIAICGGDGTIHEVVNALVGAEVVVGILPSGRGNDLARALGVPKDVRGIVETLVNGTVRQIDLGRIGERYFCTVASLGLDTVVAKTVYENRVPFSGQLAYTLAVLKCLGPFQCPHVTLVGDFGKFEGRIFVAATGNTAFYGSGIQVVPSAVADSGHLELCLLFKTSKWTVLGLFAKAFSGRHVDSEWVRVEKTETLSIVSEEPLWIFADGEPVCQTPATIEVVPRALKIKVPIVKNGGI